MAKSTPPAGKQPADSYKVFVKYVGPQLQWLARGVVLGLTDGLVYVFPVESEGGRPDLPGHPSWWLPVDAKALETAFPEGQREPIEVPLSPPQHRVWTAEELQAGALKEDWPDTFYPDAKLSKPEEPTDA